MPREKVRMIWTEWKVKGKGRDEGERWRCTGEVNSDGSYHPGDRGRREEANGDKIKSESTGARGEYRRLRKTPAASMARGEEKVVDARPAGQARGVQRLATRAS